MTAMEQRIHEYHVKESTVTPGRWWVLNPLDLIHCVHTSEEQANSCASGRCGINVPKGYSTR